MNQFEKWLSAQIDHALIRYERRPTRLNLAALWVFGLFIPKGRRYDDYNDYP